MWKTAIIAKFELKQKINAAVVYHRSNLILKGFFRWMKFTQKMKTVRFKVSGIIK